MFGYQEPDFAIEQTATVVWDGKSVQVQKCYVLPPYEVSALNGLDAFPDLSEEIAESGYQKYYLAFGDVNNRVVLQYRRDDFKYLEEDWALLLAGRVAQMTDLRYAKRIQDDLGFDRNGGVCMY